MFWGYVKKHTKKFTKPEDTKTKLIKTYGPARGIFVGVADETKFAIGVSLVNAKHDRFNERLGKNLAEGRATKLLNIKTEAGKTPILIVPASILSQVHKFIARARKYYPGKEPCFKIETAESQLSAKDLQKLDGVFGDAKPDEKAAEELNRRGGDFVPGRLAVPIGLNEFFLQAGNDTLLVRKKSNKWEVVEV